MNLNKKILSGILVICTGILYAGCKPDGDVSASGDDTKSGEATVDLNHVFGVAKNGSPDPTGNAVCKQKFSQYVGKPVHTTYQINPKTLIMSAKSEFDSKSFLLSALGIAGEYSFGTFQPVNFPKAYAVLFSINEDFSKPRSKIMMNHEPYDCLLSSEENPFYLPESSKFASSESGE